MPILYLISKYGGREAESIEENNHAVAQLLEKGFIPFSPIVNSHHFDLWLKAYNEAKYLGQAMNGYYKIPNYYEYDLALMTGWLHNDGGDCYREWCNQCNKPMMSIDESREHGQHKKVIRDWIQYDSGFVAVVLPSAYEDFGVRVWLSKGAKLEYEWCKVHHVLVIALETALTIPQEQWRDYAL
jgi:hypothetical protein